jgi:hypothetical protein
LIGSGIPLTLAIVGILPGAQLGRLEIKCCADPESAAADHRDVGVVERSIGRDEIRRVTAQREMRPRHRYDDARRSPIIARDAHADP